MTTIGSICTLTGHPLLKHFKVLPGEKHVFRSKVFEPTLSDRSYRIFIEGLKSPVTKGRIISTLKHRAK